MSQYIIDWKSNNLEGIPGKEPITLPGKELDVTSSSLTLTGKSVRNFGEIQQENFLHLLENFASANPPDYPTIGQLWYNTNEEILYLRIDPSSINQFEPRYYPQSPASWVQIWPSVQEYASLNDFNTIALTINRIIGSPSFVSGPAPFNQYGWGQTDLVPVYTDASTLAPGFDPLIYPPQFDNNAWVILLSRLRKALRHVGQPETGPSPVGFISDGRPNKDGNTLANIFNNYPSVGTLPNYSSGWEGNSQTSLQSYFTNTLTAISQLDANRFNKSPASTEFTLLGSTTRNTDWTYTVEQIVNVTFTNEDKAKSFFNAGGHIKFDLSFIPTGADILSMEWQSFLSTVSGITFDFNGIKQNSAYLNAPGDIAPKGFYLLTSIPQLLFVSRRDDPNTIHSTIVDGGFQLEASTSTALDNKFTVTFKLSFVEAPYPGETVAGTLLSSQTAFKANNVNINSPVINYPTWTSTAISDAAIIPPVGPPVIPAPPSPPTYDLQPSANVTIGEGLTGQTFTVTTTNVSDGTILYWSTLAGTGITTGDFTDNALTGNVIINSNSGSFVRSATADLTTEGTETFTVQLRTGSIAGPVVATSGTISIADNSNNATTVSGTLSGSGALTIPAGVTSITLTGRGGTGGIDPGQPYIPSSPGVYAWDTSSYWQVTNLGQSATDPGYPTIPATTTVFWTAALPTGTGQTTTSYIVQDMGGSPLTPYRYYTYTAHSVQISAPVIGQPYIAPFAYAGPNTTATISPNTATWYGGYGGIATTSTQVLPCSGVGDTMNYSIGSGGNLSYSYTI